ncbi:unnamed protein product [Gordionus sp. m RMFG-2023]|uniref:U4/U6.U5 tri-snRNP-associated protein 1-like n=1 Tax=Gordionus sp. m RMFG-2023 TaxID=3053472 RepID=UPI0030E40BB0
MEGKKHKKHKSENKNEHHVKKKHKHKHKKHKVSEDILNNANVNNMNEDQDYVPTHGDVSLSIDDTNKLREKLGLTLLKTESSDKVEEMKDGLKKYTMQGDTFIHVPPQNWGAAKASDKLKDKLSTRKEKREIEQKLRKVKKLAEFDNEDESALSWVNKSRQLQKDKEVALKKAKILEELDEDFGIDQLVESNLPNFKRKHENWDKEYSAKYLKGIKVDHSLDAFQEGETIIMTLADKDILKEMEEAEAEGSEEIILQNINIIDSERAIKYIQTKKIRPEYKPYLEEEKQYDEFGLYKPKNLLDKYDEEIGEGPKKETFILGENGIVNASGYKQEKEMQMKKMREGLNIDTLETAPLTIAKEYYTHEEIAEFRKRPKKKNKKFRPKSSHIIDDDQEHNRKDNSNNNDKAYTIHGQVMDEKEMLKIVDEEEEKNRMELEESLRRVRRKVVDNGNSEPDFSDANVITLKGPHKVMDIIKNELSQILSDEEHESTTNINERSEPGNTKKSHIVLNTTSEFCRILGNIQANALSDKNEDQNMDTKKYESDIASSDEDESKIDKFLQTTQEKVSITQEPDIEKGLAQALILVKAKGYLDKGEQDIEMSAEYLDLKCKRFNIEDKHFDIDDKYTRRDRYSSGPLTDFKEKKDYVPDIKLDYIDDVGKILNTKEAFRYMSHKFHGKGSGKKKIEKRNKKIVDVLQNVKTDHSPMNTVNLLLNKQKEIKAPYLILSGRTTTHHPAHMK